MVITKTRRWRSEGRSRFVSCRLTGKFSLIIFSFAEISINFFSFALGRVSSHTSLPPKTDADERAPASVATLNQQRARRAEEGAKGQRGTRKGRGVPVHHLFKQIVIRLLRAEEPEDGAVYSTIVSETLRVRAPNTTSAMLSHLN